MKLARLLGLVAASFSTCSAGSSFIDFRSVDGKLKADNETFHLKGINWFGAETIELAVQGLWPSATSIGDAMDLFASYDINALRLPLAMDSVMDDPKVKSTQTGGSPSLAGKTYLEVLDVIVREARARNILIMFDSHRIEASEPDFPDIAVPNDITPALQKLATRYCTDPGAWNVFAMDIKNEPKGKATWGKGDEDTDWNLQAAKIGNAVLKKCPRLLIFVQGVQTNIKGVSMKWGQAGGSLQGAKDYPVKLSNMERLVYSPHLISPGVDYKAPWWGDSSFPDNMPDIWDEYFGFVPRETGQAVVVGSWGAQMKEKNKQWAKAVSSYLEEKSIGSFYWAFNPQSADTGGFVKDDWATPIDERAALLELLPTTSVEDVVAIFAKCSKTCAGNGGCEGGKCVCYTGWSGPQCEICSEGDASACNDMGTCLRNSTCECEDDANGKYCAGTECDEVDCGDGSNAGCFNGECTCLYNCVGNSCVVCAANDSALEDASNGATILCDACDAQTHNDFSAAQATSPVTVATAAFATLSLVLTFFFQI
ncbi:Cellulase (glycosyl hydrolase family 5) [Phytophthora infestans]|uniref:Cellulase (Glycosyl hydrolase family 5) n=1 Tax=Phytophthora infestans TaxID=4787 RepID=A0A8S9UYL0_PHYIN|nr:Cellulase (glycosyl hydrolase family 5) [Phytophthora infestans]